MKFGGCRQSREVISTLSDSSPARSHKHPKPFQSEPESTMKLLSIAAVAGIVASAADEDGLTTEHLEFETRHFIKTNAGKIRPGRRGSRSNNASSEGKKPRKLARRSARGWRKGNNGMKMNNGGNNNNGWWSSSGNSNNGGWWSSSSKSGKGKSGKSETSGKSGKSETRFVDGKDNTYDDKVFSLLSGMT